MSKDNNTTIFKTSMSKPSFTNTFLSHELFDIEISSLLFVGNAKTVFFNSFLKQIKDVAIFSSRGRAFHKRAAETANARSP